MVDNLDVHLQGLKEVNIKDIQQKVLFELQEIDKNNSKSPFYCFDNDVSDIENLNFNNLKKCDFNVTFKKEKFFVLHVKKEDGDSWFQAFNINSHKKEQDFIFELIKSVEPKTTTFNGKMLKIFHTQYKPTTN